MFTGDSRSTSRRTVQPIRNPQEIERIRSILEGKPRDLLLFDLATQTGLQMKDLLTLRVKDLLDLEAGETFPLTGERRENSHTATMTESICQTFRRYLQEADLSPNEYLFKSRKGQKHLTLSSVSNIIRGWFQAADIRGPYGAKSLKKTWEYFAENPSVIHHGLFGDSDKPGLLESIERLPVQEQIYNKLLKGIASGRIPPGARLITAELSARFKVSPTPVRMALSRLEARGFIIPQKKKAFYVARLSIESLEEIIAIRLALETLGVELSCKIRSEGTLKSLESLLRVYEQANSFDDYQQANKQFHLTLCRDANMPMLQQMISDLCDRVTPYFALFSEGNDRPSFHQENIQVHRGMLESFRCKDPKKLCKWLKADLNQSLSTIKKMLEKKSIISRESKITGTPLPLEISG